MCVCVCVVCGCVLCVCVLKGCKLGCVSALQYHAWLSQDANTQYLQVEEERRTSAFNVCVCVYVCVACLCASFVYSMYLYIISAVITITPWDKLQYCHEKVLLYKEFKLFLCYTSRTVMLEYSAQRDKSNVKDKFNRYQ